MNNTPISLLDDLSACSQSKDWVKAQNMTSLEDAWLKCERPDWLLWFAAKRGLDRKKLVFIACQCARTALKYTKDERVLKCIETTEAWTRDEVSIEDLKKARDAADAAYASASASASAAYASAYASASAAYASAYASASAAYASASASAAYASAYASASAAYASAYASASAASAAYASDARIKAQKECADIVRKYLPELP